MRLRSCVYCGRIHAIDYDCGKKPNKARAKDPDSIPAYSGEDHIILNNGIPCFNSWDLKNIHGEKYSVLDDLGRCGIAIAMLDRTMMPTGERGEIV